MTLDFSFDFSLLMTMRLRQKLAIFSLFPSQCTPQKTNNNDIITCPCFTSETLEYFTTENTNDSNSCKGLPNSISIWKVQDPKTWHPMGYGAHLHQPTCLYEGDIMRVIELEEAKACYQLIQNRCEELGLLTSEK